MTGPSLPFYVILAPGDLFDGKQYSATEFYGPVPMSASDYVQTQADSLAATVIFTTGTSPHTFTVLPYTQVNASGPDGGTSPGAVSCAYLTISHWSNASNYPGIMATSGTYDGSLSAAPATKVVVKTGGSTTVVTGSSFLLTLQPSGNSTDTVLDLYDYTKAQLTNTYTAKGAQMSAEAIGEYTYSTTGLIAFKSEGAISHFVHPKPRSYRGKKQVHMLKKRATKS